MEPVKTRIEYSRKAWKELGGSVGTSAERVSDRGAASAKALRGSLVCVLGGLWAEAE